MPRRANRFRHQRYEVEPRTSPPLHAAGSPPSVGDSAWRETLDAAASAWRRAGVDCVYLVHGTFVGTDPMGLAACVGCLAPSWGSALGRRTKSLLDRLLGDAGTYVAAFADDLRAALNRVAPETPADVRLFHWTSENHHAARAEAAVRLLDELMQLRASPGKRVLCWGHSHGGNVLALATTLAACDPDEAAPFFEAARPCYRRSWRGRVRCEAWERVEACLRSSARPLLRVPVDVVTFGTPIRYGWSLAPGARLLHFVHHRARAGRAEHRAAPPRSLCELVRGGGGDYTHQLGIAGSNLMPLPLRWRTWLADRRLSQLLQPRDYGWWNWFTHFRYGLRVHDEGETALVDYGDPASRSIRSLTGHLHYTQRQWLPFHAAETARRLYSAT